MGISVLFVLALAGARRGGLTSDDIKMLEDPGGWEYLSVSDNDGGIQTTHTCFDGHPHPQECSGTITLTAGNTFTQNVHIHGQSIQRHGTYRLDDQKISFFDEFGTEDGPYTLDLNTQTKHLTLAMPPVRIELELKRQHGRNRPGTDTHQ